MIFGNLNQVLENEQTIYEAAQNVMNSGYKAPKQSKLSKILTSLSKYGMNYSDDIQKNMQAIPADKLLQPKEDALLQQSLWGAGVNNWKVKPEEEKGFAQKSLTQKRDILRKMAMQPELEDILDIMANESIVYDDDLAYICQPFLDTALIQELNEKSADEIRAAVESAFYNETTDLIAIPSECDKCKQPIEINEGVEGDIIVIALDPDTNVTLDSIQLQTEFDF